MSRVIPDSGCYLNDETRLRSCPETSRRGTLLYRRRRRGVNAGRYFNNDYLSDVRQCHIALSLNDDDNNTATTRPFARRREYRNHASSDSDLDDRVLLTKRTSRLGVERGLTSGPGNQMRYPRRRTSWLARRRNPVPHRCPVAVSDSSDGRARRDAQTRDALATQGQAPAQPLRSTIKSQLQHGAK